MKLKFEFKKNTIIAGVITGAWVCLTLYIMSLLKIRSSWPAFMPFVLYAVSGWKTDQLKSIFAGGVVGILYGAIVLQGIGLIIGKTGITETYMVVIFIAIFLLIALGDIFPVIFNNYTFCFYTIAFITEKQDTFAWVLTTLLGGAFFVGGLLFFYRIFLKQEPEEKPQEVNVTETVKV